MHLPILDANTAASYQTYAAAIQGLLTIFALAIAIGVPVWQQKKARSQDQDGRCRELNGLRLALKTEVGLVARLCLHEQTAWNDAASSAADKKVRTAKLPPLIIYSGNANRIGLLSRGEIISLIKFSSTLNDIAVVVRDIERGDALAPKDCRTLQMLFSNACGYAAEFFVAVPDVEGATLDQVFVLELKARFKLMNGERARARQAAGMSRHSTTK
jgi:hypothetical protein